MKADSGRPLFTVAICTGREEEEAFFPRWLAMKRAIQAGEHGKAVPTGVRDTPRLRQLILDCIDLRDSSFLVPTLRSLANQTFRDFEVVVVDCALATRPKYAVPDGIPALRVVEPHDTPWLHEPWHDGFDPPPTHWSRKYSVVSAAFNTAIANARGHFMAITGDCIVVEPDYLQIMADHLNRGFIPYGGHVQLLWPDRGCGRPTKPGRWEPMLSGIPDARYQLVTENARMRLFTELRVSTGRELEAYGISVGRGTQGSYFNGAALPMWALLMINGFDETFDGVCSTEDLDWCGRLTRLLHSAEIINDPRLIRWELGHYHFHWLRFCVRHNPILGQMIAARWPDRIRANDERPDAIFWQEYKKRIGPPEENNCALMPNFALTAPPLSLVAEREQLGNWVPEAFK